MVFYLPFLYPFLSHKRSRNVFWKARQGKAESLISDGQAQRFRDLVLLLYVFKMNGTRGEYRSLGGKQVKETIKTTVLFGASVCDKTVHL